MTILRLNRRIMQQLARYLQPITVQLETVLLDPNNPRFADLGEELNTQELRFAEPKVQKDTFERMKSSRFEVSELRDTIKTLGFLPMDKIVVRSISIQGREYFVVVEGNRRITAIKWLIDLHEAGKETLSDEFITDLRTLEVLKLDTDNAPQEAIHVLPGLRHVSGIKEWGPYQKAKTVYELRDKGASAQEAAQALGLSTKAANSLWRSYLALNQMKDDEEYGEFAESTRYSYFEEIFKRPQVKNWLEWSDERGQFTNLHNLSLLYMWIVGNLDESEETRKPKLREAKSIRDLGEIIVNKEAFDRFQSNDDPIENALAIVVAKKDYNIQASVDKVIDALNSIPINELKNDGERIKMNLDKLLAVINERLDDLRAFGK